MYNITFRYCCGHCAYGIVGMCAERKLCDDSSCVLQIVIGFPAVAYAREHNLVPLAAFIAQQFPTQIFFEDTIFRKPKVDVLYRQALTLSRPQK